MGRHSRAPERRRILGLRPTAVTSVLAAGLVGAIAAATALGAHATTGAVARTAASSASASAPSSELLPSSGAAAGTDDRAPRGDEPSPDRLGSVSAYAESSAATGADPGAGGADSSAASTGSAGSSGSSGSSGGAGGAGGSGGSGGGPVLGRTGVAPADTESARVGALFTGSASAGNHFCTASVLHSTTRNLVLTAAHCLSSADGVTFVPGYRNGQAPYGTWQVTRITTADAWQSGGDPDADFAILQVAPSGGRQIEDVVGGNPLGTDAGWTATVRLYGYPSSTEQPILCTNATTRQDTYQRRIDCPSFPGGTSGGPWIDTATGKVVGVIGGYQQGGDTEDISYSAAFDQTIGQLYQQAVSSAG